MKEIILKGGEVALVDEDDFNEFSQYKWRKSTNGYAIRSEGNKNFYMHREVTKCPKGKVVDHINRNKLDNRKENLRICSDSQNGFNRPANSNSLHSKYKGVTRHVRNDSYVMQIVKNRKCVSKSFTDEIACANYYNHMALELHGEYALLNDVPFMTIEECEKFMLHNKRGNYAGVSKVNSGKWKAVIKSNGKEISVGTFATEIEALTARNEKCIELGLLDRVQEIKEEA